MSRYHAYPEYKDSGVEWLGEAPLHWATVHVGRLYTRTKRTDCADKELLSVYRDYGVIPTSSRDDNNNKPSDDLTAYQLVEPNNLVMNKMKAWQGSIAISEYEGIVSPAYFVYQPNSKMFDLAIPKYIHYLLRHPIYIAQYLRQSKGIRVNQWDLDPDEFKKIELLLPEKREQEKIIAFLDHETAKIDALIEKQQRLIELLKEKRQAVISYAVTKGLNPNAPMKDSGVEWLGEVPAHWKVMKFGLCAFLQEGPGLRTWQFQEEGVRVICVTNITNKGIDFSLLEKFISKQEYLSSYQHFTVNSGDLLVSSSGNSWGKVARYSDEEKVILNTSTIRISELSDKKISTEFIELFLQSDACKEQLGLAMTGSCQPNFGPTHLNEVKTMVPPMSEQLEISKFIKKKIQQFENPLNACEQAISLMQERRTALISAAVTGKIDVRNWQAAA